MQRKGAAVVPEFLLLTSTSLTWISTLPMGPKNELSSDGGDREMQPSHKFA